CRGVVNAVRLAAALIGAVAEGEHVSEKALMLSQPTKALDPDNGNPFFHWMNPPAYTSDRYNVSFHGSAHSHLDALCHYQLLGVSFDGLVTAVNNTGNTTAAVGGCAKYGIQNLMDGILTRSVLFDAAGAPARAGRSLA